jgi:hypothetical protein
MDAKNFAEHTNSKHEINVIKSPSRAGLFALTSLREKVRELQIALLEKSAIKKENLLNTLEHCIQQ